MYKSSANEKIIKTSPWYIEYNQHYWQLTDFKAGAEKVYISISDIFGTLLKLLALGT